MKFSKSSILLGVAAIAGATAISVMAENAAEPKDRGISHADQEFVNAAYQANETELRLGQIAQDKASSEGVKHFAMHMVKDHTEVEHGLSTLVSEYRGALPSGVDKEHTKKADEIAAKSGADFDKAYMDAMVRDHEEAVDLFEKQANAGHSPTDEWAAKVLPNLKEHLHMAIHTGKEVGAPAATDDAIPAKYKENAREKNEK